MVSDFAKNIKKDFLIEYRSASSIASSLAFAVVMVIGVSIISGGRAFGPMAHSVLLWLMVFFSAINSLFHIFQREIDQGTDLMLRVSSAPEMVLLSKMIYNTVLFILLEAVVIPLYCLFGGVVILSYSGFAVNAVCGCVSIALASTALASLASLSGGRGAVFAVISLPVMLPILVTAASGTVQALSRADVPISGAVFLLAFSGFIAAISFMLFRFIWENE